MLVGILSVLEMLLVVVVTLVLVARYGKQPHPVQVVGGILLAVGVYVLTPLILQGLFSLTLYVADGDRFGDPFWQILLPACCVGVLLAAMDRPWMARYGGQLCSLGIMALLLWQYYSSLNVYTGKPARLVLVADTLAETERVNLIWNIITKMGEEDARRVYPAGWLSTHPLARELSEIPRTSLDINYYRCGKEWHSPLTHLYPVIRRPARAWYPGGRPVDVLANIEYRTKDGQVCTLTPLPIKLTKKEEEDYGDDLTELLLRGNP